VLAAYVDQSISTNTFYSPKHFANGKIPGTLIAKNLMLGTHWGLKSFYYSLVDKIGSKSSLEESNNVIEAVFTQPVQFDEESCESCKL
jgi:ribonucleoside-diphosphate reductase alpha chain